MGSKNLKAISIQGTGSVKVADPQGLLDLVEYTQNLCCRKLYETTPEAPANSYVGSWQASLPLTDTDLYKEARDPEGKLEIAYTGCYSCPWGGCGYGVRFKDGSGMSLGQLRCTEAIPVSAESAACGEYVGRAHMKRLTLNERLGLSDCNTWFQGLDPIFQAGNILTEENTGIDWTNFGTEDFTRELMYSVAYQSTEVGAAIAKGWRYFLEEYIGTPEAKYFYRAIRGIRNSPKHNGGGVCGWYIPGAYLAPGLLRFATSNLNATDIRCTGAETYLLFGSNGDLLPPGSDEWQALVDGNSTKLFGSPQVYEDIRNWDRESDSIAPFCKWNHQFKALDDSLIFCYIAMSAMGILLELHRGPRGRLRYSEEAVQGGHGHRLRRGGGGGLRRAHVPARARHPHPPGLRPQRRSAVRRGVPGVLGRESGEQLLSDRDRPDQGALREDARRLVRGHGLRCGHRHAKVSTFEAAGVPEIADRLVSEYGVQLPA